MIRFDSLHSVPLPYKNIAGEQRALLTDNVMSLEPRGGF